MFRGTIGCIILVVINGFEEDPLKYIAGARLSFISIYIFEIIISKLGTNL